MTLFQPTAPCLIDAVLDELELSGVMGIGIDNDLHADFSGAKQMHII